MLDRPLYFFHIPKTGGTSLIKLLDSYFAPEDIFPPQLWPELLAFPNVVNRLKTAKLIRGHLDNGIYDFLPTRPYTITLFREPVAHTISHYRHIVQHSDHEYHSLCHSLSLESALAHDLIITHFTNFQRSSIYLYYNVAKAGFELLETEKNPPIHKLNEFDLVGITERLPQFVLLLCMRLGWQPPQTIPHENQDPDPGFKQAQSSEVIAQIRDLTQKDARLYELARTRFEREYAEMLAQLGFAQHEKPDYAHVREAILTQEIQAQVAVPPPAAPLWLAPQPLRYQPVNERSVEIPWALANLPQRGAILDIGSCEATYLSALAQHGRIVHALDARDCRDDIPEAVVFHAQNLFGNSLLPLSYDAILCLSTLEHLGLPHYGSDMIVGGDALALAEMARLLKPAGTLLVTVPAGISKTTLWYRQYSAPDLAHLFAHWHTEISYFGYQSGAYVPITATHLDEYDYDEERGAGAVACIIARSKGSS